MRVMVAPHPFRPLRSDARRMLNDRIIGRVRVPVWIIPHMRCWTVATSCLCITRHAATLSMPLTSHIVVSVRRQSFSNCAQSHSSYISLGKRKLRAVRSHRKLQATSCKLQAVRQAVLQAASCEQQEENSCYRSHFGSRCNLSCCGHSQTFLDGSSILSLTPAQNMQSSFFSSTRCAPLVTSRFSNCVWLGACPLRA